MHDLTATVMHPCYAVDLILDRVVQFPVDGTELGDAYMLALSHRPCAPCPPAILDFRSKEDFAAGHVANSLSVALKEPGSTAPKDGVILPESSILFFSSEEDLKTYEHRIENNGVVIVVLGDDVMKGVLSSSSDKRTTMVKRTLEDLATNQKVIRLGFTPHDHFKLLYSYDSSLYVSEPPTANWIEHTPAGDHVIKNLWIGSSNDATKLDDMKKIGIKKVINCAAECACHHPHEFEYLRLMAEDIPKHYIAKHFDAVEDFIRRADEAGENVLVHCAMGRSRAATISVMYLMRTQMMTLYHAWLYLKTKRPEISINPGFLQQLEKDERRLFGGSCISVETKNHRQASQGLDAFLFADRD